MNLRRSLAAGTVGLLAIAVLTACGFNYPTDRISNLTVGTDYRDGNVDVLNAVVVSTAGNGGTFVATLVNNTDSEQQLTGITGTGKVAQVDVTPVTDQAQRPGQPRRRGRLRGQRHVRASATSST